MSIKDSKDGDLGGDTSRLENETSEKTLQEEIEEFNSYIEELEKELENTVCESGSDSKAKTLTLHGLKMEKENGLDQLLFRYLIDFEDCGHIPKVFDDHVADLEKVLRFDRYAINALESIHLETLVYKDMWRLILESSNRETILREMYDQGITLPTNVMSLLLGWKDESSVLDNMVENTENILIVSAEREREQGRMGAISMLCWSFEFLLGKIKEMPEGDNKIVEILNRYDIKKEIIPELLSIVTKQWWSLIDDNRESIERRASKAQKEYTRKSLELDLARRYSHIVRTIIDNGTVSDLFSIITLTQREWPDRIIEYYENNIGKSNE